MTQGVAMLRALIATERIASFAASYGVSKVYCIRIASELTYPDWLFINKTKTQIEPERWFDEANEGFIELMEKNTLLIKESQHIRNQLHIKVFDYEFSEEELKEFQEFEADLYDADDAAEGIVRPPRIDSYSEDDDEIGFFDEEEDEDYEDDDFEEEDFDDDEDEEI